MVNLYEGYEQTNYPCQLRIIGRVKCKQNEMTMVWIKKPLRKKKRRGRWVSQITKKREWGLSSHGEYFEKLTLQFMSHNISSVLWPVRLRCYFTEVHHSQLQRTCSQKPKTVHDLSGIFPGPCVTHCDLANTSKWLLVTSTVKLVIIIFSLSLFLVFFFKTKMKHSKILPRHERFYFSAKLLFFPQTGHIKFNFLTSSPDV